MNCGPASDSCGGLLNCGTCTAPQTCGGGGVAGACGPAACVPKTCAQLGKNCGAVSDGCGGLLSCGTCNWPQTCGGAGTPSVCGTNPSCTNLCLQQVTCSGSGTTRITGTVYAPNGVDPLPNAVVYVPNGTVEPFTTSVSCDNCAQASGSPLIGTTSATDGTFTLNNVPVGSNIPLVIQIGRWRRQVAIPTVTSCTTTALPASLTRLPKNKTEGDIPKQAFVTGYRDAMECVLRKIGVDDAEFTNPVGNGRIHLYGAADPDEMTVSTPFNYEVGYGAYKGGGAGPTSSTAITPTGTTEWDYRLLDTHSWLMADAMSYSRAYHAAVLLPDGRVLVAGGLGASGTTAAATTNALNTVEIYDPSTNTWTTKTSMGSARIAPTATLLPSGRVLVTGGYSGSTYYATAELYNPATNTWSNTPSMTGSGRARHTATLLDNGKVLVVGGTTNGTASNATASLYDPATNTWSATLGAPTGRFYHSATLLSNGKVLIAGGVTSGTTSVNSAQLFDPLSNTFAATPTNMPAVRQQHSDTRLTTGKVLLAGGVGSSTSSLATTAIYDPTANTWTAGPSMASSRKGHEAALLSDGTVVAFGGVDGTTYRTTEETYSPTSNTWSVVGYGYNYTHAYHTATTLQNGRVLMAGGYTSGGTLLGYSELLVNQPVNQYDIVLFPCPGNAYYYSPASAQQRYQNNLANFANIGGRIFTTHFTYNWIYNDNSHFFSPLSSAVGWNINQTPNPADQLGYIDQSFAKGAQLAQWLKIVVPSSTLGQIQIEDLRRDFNSAPASTQNWMSVNQPTANTKMHVTFNTPLGVSSVNQCGRVVFSDFHVFDKSVAGGSRYAYPGECSNSAMTPQEKLLEFMMFDLASCITPDSIATCVPTTCAALGLNCGQAGDGCGGTLSCGTCPTGQVCGWGSMPNVCTVPTACVPTTCAGQGLSCGPSGNGCGGSLDCGTCPSPQVCGGGGPGQCGLPISSCAPTTCSALGLSCGPAGDGCGNALDCGSCTAPATCGGGGTRGECGSPPACVPTTCAALGANCGSTGDGCGGTLNCGSCSAPDTCGGGGQPGRCGHTTEYLTGTFVRDYSSSCAAGTSPVWSLWSWNSTTPSNSRIDFTVQTATTAAGLATAPSDPLLFSSPPGPTVLAGTPASARAANQVAGTPDTQLGAADVDSTFAVNDRPRNNAHVRVTSTLVPSSDKTQTALLTSWNLQMSCVPHD